MIKTCSEIDTKPAVGSRHNARKIRLEFVRKLLFTPDVTVVQDNGLSNDTDVKQYWGEQSRKAWGRLGNANAESPSPSELGIDEEGAKLAQLGKEYLRMERMCDHYSAARVRNVLVRQVETKGISECPCFCPNAFDMAQKRYYECLNGRKLQRKPCDNEKDGVIVVELRYFLMMLLQGQSLS